MKCGILLRWGSAWVGAHWSPYNRRLCVNLVPFVTVWFQLPPAEAGIDQRAEARIKEFHKSREIKRAAETKAIRAIGKAWKTMPEDDLKKLKGLLHKSLKDELPPEEFKVLFDKALNAAPTPEQDNVKKPEAKYSRLDESKEELRVAENILQLVNNELPTNGASQSNAIWLAFQAHYGPASAGLALQHYGFICSHK